MFLKDSWRCTPSFKSFEAKCASYDKFGEKAATLTSYYSNAYGHCSNHERRAVNDENK